VREKRRKKLTESHSAVDCSILFNLFLQSLTPLYYKRLRSSVKGQVKVKSRSNHENVVWSPNYSSLLRNQSRWI